MASRAASSTEVNQRTRVGGGLAVGGGVVLVALFGALFLGESLLPIGWVGVVLIALGSFLVASK